MPAPGLPGKAVLTVLHLQKVPNAVVVLSHHHPDVVEMKIRPRQKDPGDFVCALADHDVISP